MSKCIVLVGIFAIVSVIVGGQWDAWMHAKQGHTVFAVPHLIIIGGFSLFFVSGIFALSMLLKDRKLLDRERRSMWLVAVGGIMTPIGLVLDEGWHRFINLDMTVWSIPHGLMFLSVTCVLVGLADFTIHRNKLLPIFFFAAILTVGFFSLLDFDQPHMSWVADSRPGFTYAITITGISTFTFALIITAMRHVGLVTAIASIAWILYTAIGYTVGMTGGFFNAFPPFPIIIPAIALDISLLVFRGRFLIPAFISATTCYWGVIGWATLYTGSKLPQQLSGGPIDWLIWYVIFIPAGSYIIPKLARAISNWAFNDIKYADSARMPRVGPTI